MNLAAYVSARARMAVAAQDIVLVLALVVLATGRPSAFTVALGAGIVTVLAWGMATLHFPRRVTWDDAAITFSAHGRAHTFAWRDVAHVRVRRFLVRDRVLVRLLPSPPWRGRYWLLANMEGYEALVAELEARAAR